MSYLHDCTFNPFQSSVVHTEAIHFICNGFQMKWMKWLIRVRKTKYLQSTGFHNPTLRLNKC